MNIGLFNCINTTSKEGSGTMYSEWTSLQSVLQSEENSSSVLNKFPGLAGRDVVSSVVKHLSQNLGISGNHCDQSNLESDREVLWCMEVMCYGLSLPLSEHETIKDCVSVYCEWLMALRSPKACVPKPVCDDPNLYARKMIQHFFNLFKPRADATADFINKQAVLCHRVLRRLQVIAQESSILSRETWDTLLMFLLAINDTLLAPPVQKDDIGDQMCERVLSVLFEIWLLACARCFPSPSLWKTFRDMCLNWRHRAALVEQWNRVTLALTSRLLKFMYGSSFPELKISEDDSNLVPSDMSNECIAQAWFRFLHTLQNPVDLCRPTVIGQAPKFIQYSLSSHLYPSQHPCLMMLPQIFLRAMKGIATLVDAFLVAKDIENVKVSLRAGIGGSSKQIILSEDISDTSGISQFVPDEVKTDASVVRFAQPQQSVTPPQQKKIGKSFSVSSASISSKSKPSGVEGHPKSSLMMIKSHSHSSNQSSASSHSHVPPTHQPPINSLDSRLPLAPNRPKCNSILHMFGSWLFEASLIGTHVPVLQKNIQLMESRRGSGSSASEASDVSSDLSVENYEAGRAEAIGALCRIFCAKKTGEEILPVYLARFYLSVQQGLKAGEKMRSQVLCSILFNSCDLLNLDLDGVQVLVPHLLGALEMVLPDKELKFSVPPSIPLVELRRASIHILLSMLPLPLHFKNLPIKDIAACGDRPQVTFHSLRPRLVNLLCNALQCESDSTNTQMLLGGLLLCVQDAAVCEEVEQLNLQQDFGVDSSSNLLSSVTISDTLSSHSLSDYSGPGMDEPDSLEAETCVYYDSAHALFVRATYLVCHRLISSWKTDLNISLAALELLSGFAKIKIQEQDAMECKRAVKWICDYIVYQCSRPPPAHSKDLHSTIVAAFQCVTMWLVEHPYLLQDKECLNTVLEVVELGISGSKSQAKHTDIPQLKKEKDCKPASMRVHDAAEAVLTCILDHVGGFPSPCGPESLSSLLDEESLLQYCNCWDGNTLTKEDAIKHFRYFVIENAYILALLEQPLGNDQDPQPTVTVLIRGPFLRNAWTMQLRHLPRHKSGTKGFAINPGRPLPMNDVGVVHSIQPRCFPESIDLIPPCNAEKSIPTLDSLITDNITQEHSKLSQLMDMQIQFEESVKRRVQERKIEYPNPETECKAPSVCQEFQTARLFLSHFGFLSLEALKESLTCPIPPLVALEATQDTFIADLDALDNISCRTYDTVFIFYVKSGQKTAEEILRNTLCRNSVHPYFIEFLGSVGWPVNVNSHPGWTGHINTSWKNISNNASEATEQPTLDHGGSLYNGQHQVLYWADVSSEIAFVVPSAKPKPMDSSSRSDVDDYPDTANLAGFERAAPERHSMPNPGPTGHYEMNKPRTLSLDLDKTPLKEKESPNDGKAKKFGRQQSSITGCDTKVLLVWLESYEDHLNFPLNDILMETVTGMESTNYPTPSSEKDAFVIFIHALQNGLFRIHMQGQNNRISMAIPLVDGMIVSRRVLGRLVRQTALNMCRRKRLENEGYQPSHVRRKLKIQEIVNKYRSRVSESEFYAALFNYNSV